jgi:hypothetical protein
MRNAQEVIDGTPEHYQMDTGIEPQDNNEPLEFDHDVVITEKCKISKVQVITGSGHSKKRVKLELIIKYDSDETSALNDMLGEYAELQMIQKVYKVPLSDKAKDDLNQIRFDFENEVGE